jgi:hypothetical protein
MAQPQGRLREEPQKLKRYSLSEDENMVWTTGMVCGRSLCGWGLVKTNGTDRREGKKQTIEMVQL